MLEDTLPLLLSRSQAMELLGVDVKVFEVIADELPYVQPKKRKYYPRDDVIKYVQRQKKYENTPCIGWQKIGRKTRQKKTLFLYHYHLISYFK